MGRGLKVDCGKRKPPLFREIHWKKSVPFGMAFCGLLVHRVKSAATYRDDLGNATHTAAEWWCGNITSHPRFVDSTMPCVFSEYGVCARCERAARDAGLPTSAEIAGHRVRYAGVCSGRFADD